MKKLYVLIILLATGLYNSIQTSADVLAQNESYVKKVNIFDHVVYYDGYQQKVYDADLNDGVYRIKNSLYSKKLDLSQLSDLDKDLTLDVTIGALCDNYDRIGTLFLAFVPKGAERYEYDEVSRIEIARFITPFMDKNKQPDEVPYSYDVPNVAKILKDYSITSEYDLWMEMEVFGVPYSANTQIAGCKDRNDVFEATVSLLYTPTDALVVESGNVVVPIYVKTPDEFGNVNFNNYNEEATDTLGVTTRTFEFEVPSDVADSKVYLILTNHGANSGGEEYVRRLHLIYYDDDIVLSYTPGGVSCEPYRQYNTQANGIYNTSRPESFWKTQSNWCPGQAVPIREIDLGAQKAGKHKVMIRVPNARFVGKDGDFRPSLYFHGVTSGTMPASVDAVEMEGPQIKLERRGDFLHIISSEAVAAVYVHTIDGRLLNVMLSPSETIDLSSYQSGVLIFTFMTADGRTSFSQILK